MKLDSYPHILPRPCFDRLDGVPLPNLKNPPLYDLDARFRVMDKFADYAQVLVPFPMQPLVRFFGDAADAVDAIAAGNDFLAETAASHPERFPAFVASLPLFDVDRALAELVRVLDELGAAGVQLETTAGGKPLDAPQFRPLFDELARRGRPAWLHPVRGAASADFAGEDRARYGLWQALGWPYETSIVMARLVLDGLFERCPDLALIVHHGGAMIPHFCGRLGATLEYLASIGFDSELQEAVERLPRPLDDYFRMFYADTVLFGAGHAVACVVEYFGVDHVLFGTDMPFDPEQGPGFIRDTIDNVEQLRLNPAAVEKIYEGNVRRLLER